MQAWHPESKAGLSFALYSCVACLSVPSFPVPTAGHTPPLERTCKDPAASCLKGLVYCGI